MDSQAFDRDRRRFILVSAAASAGTALFFGAGCDTPQGMQNPRSTNVPGAGTLPGQNPAGMNGAPQSGAEPAKPKPEPAPKDGKTDKPQTIERPEPPSKEPAIRIKTREILPAAPQVTVQGSGPSVWVVAKGTGKGGKLARGPVEIRWTNVGWRITENAGTRRACVLDYSALGTLDVMSLTNEEQRITIDGVSWPGAVRLVPQGGGFDLVHEVPMEMYLSGVIAKELYNSWAVETHRAQAIAARSWAICEMAIARPQRHYDVVADERSQAWVGETKHQKSLDAVRDTAGQLLVWQDRVVPAYYSSCCGGARANAQGTISSEMQHDIGPLRAASGKRGCACTGFSKFAKWEMTLEVPAVSRALPGWGRLEGYPSLSRIGRLAELTVIARNEQGRPERVRVVDAKGWKCELTAESMRWALSASPANPAVKKPVNERVRSAFFEPKIVGDRLVLKGAGYGHGVGLCQFGTEAMAKDGAKANRILSTYYPGAQLVRAYT